MEHTRCPAKPKKSQKYAKIVFSQAYFRCHPTWSAHKGLPLLVIPGDGLAHRPGSGASRWLVTVDGWNPARKPVEVGSFSHYVRGFSTIPGGAGFLPSTEMFSLFMRFGKGCSLSSMKMFGNLGGHTPKWTFPSKPIEYSKLHWWFHLDVHHKKLGDKRTTLHQLKGTSRNSSVWPCSFWVILLMEEILHHLVDHIHPRWCRISAINRTT